MNWSPILEGGLAAQAIEAIGAIADGLEARPPQEQGDASLSGGDAGMALFFAYLAREGTAGLLLDQAIDAVASVPMGPSLYGGFPGIAWAVQHLGAEEENEAVDQALLDLLERSPWRWDYDLVQGLVGLGVYALDRLPRPAAAECLRRIVERLAEIAQPQGPGFTFRTAPELMIPTTAAQYPRGYYNLGLAHGVPGVLAVLGESLRAGICVDRVRPLLQGALEWVWAQRLPDGAGRSAFPSWLAPGEVAAPARTAWCYGDPGVAVALLVAARALGDRTWEDRALSVARGAAQRPPEQTGVKDAGLCHGAAGLAHIYNRLFHATQEALFRDAARSWFERTLAMRAPGGPLGGYRFLNAVGASRLEWVEDPGLLTGVSGVGLALLGATTGIEPRWDHMLLTSVPGLT